MNESNWFDDILTIGQYSDTDIISKLKDVNDQEITSHLNKNEHESSIRVRAGRKKKFFDFSNKPWKHTSHTFGFIPPLQRKKDSVNIIHAGLIKPQKNLKNQKIKITLDRLRVANYPGSGIHRVLFDFYAIHNLKDNLEHLHYQATHRVNEGQEAGIIGLPIFTGLQVKDEGVSFKCFTINVKNESDQAFLNTLESDVFKEGLKLTTKIQPAIAPLSKIIIGITKSIAKRNQNIPVQNFYMGLDFSNISTRARLAEGSYIAIQVPEISTFNFSKWLYKPQLGQIVNKKDIDKIIPYNYIIFGVSKM